MNPFNTNDRKADLKIRVTRGRYNLIFFVLMSVINIFLITSESEMLLPYSSSISNYSVALGITESLKSGSDTLRILGLIVACAVLLIFMVCYVLSKSKPLYLVIALAVISADTFALVIISGFNGTLLSAYTILDIVIHGLAIFYIVSAIKAAKELRSLPVDEPEQTPSVENEPVANAFSEPDTVFDEYGDEEDAEEYDEEEDEEDLSKPIGKYDDDGTEPLVQGVFEGLKVFAVIRNDKAELVINNFVCDELDVSEMYEFQLRAFVNDIDFTFDYKETVNGQVMYLYADDTLLDSLGIG